MRLNWKTAALVPAAAAAIAAGAFVLDARQDGRTEAGATAKAAPAPAANAVRSPTLPASHPALGASSPPPEAQARAGRVRQVDPARPFTHFRVGDNSVLAIYADAGVLWLGTSGGIVRYDTGTREFRTYDARDGLRVNGILYVGKLRGKIAAGSYGGGLSLLDQDTQQWDHYNVSEGLGDGFVYDALDASSGDLWIATGSGVNRVRGGALKQRAKWDLYNVQNTAGGLPHNRVYRLVEGKDGSVWFATAGGLANFRNGVWKKWTHADGLGASDEGVRHDAASGAAQPHLPPQQAAQKRETQSAGGEAAVNPNHIAALEASRDGQVWAGTRGAGLARFDGKAWINYTVIEGLPSNQISSMKFDRDGRLWVGTKNGLAVFKDGKFQVMTTAHGLLAPSVLAVTSTSDGDLWVGGFGGVAHIRRSALN